MHRAIIASAAALCLLTGVAHAQQRPSVAVLGIEVIDGGAGIDPKTTQFAGELTDVLRARARHATSPFRVAPDGDKDLLELKLLSGCADEARGCMAEIGAELGADRLLYGKVERRKAGYQVTLQLLNVATKGMERTTSDVIPMGETGAADLERWGRSLYNRLTGVPDQGTLLLSANAERGTVYVAGEVRGSLSGGQVRIAGLPEGPQTVVIEADGYERYSAEIVVVGGDTAEHEATLLAAGAIGGPKPSARPGSISRVMFWSSLAFTGASGGAMAVTGLQVRGKLKDQQLAAIEALPQDAREALGDHNANACTNAKNYHDQAVVQGVIDACDKGTSRAMLTNIFVGATVVGALATSYFYYKGYVAPKASSGERLTGKPAPRRPAVVVTPSISPDGVGAGLTIEF